MTNELVRSWLFAPATEPRKMLKALDSSADQVVFDLEDAVPHDRKEQALAQILELSPEAKRKFFVRINGLDSDRCYREICALVAAGIKGLVIPKIETAAHCSILNWLVSALEREHHLVTGSLQLVPVIETAAAFSQLRTICSHKGRIRYLSLGAWDLSLDLNMRYRQDEQPLSWARNQLVVASRAAGLAAPIDSSYIYLRDEPGLQASIAGAKDLGYQGKACIHPEQLAWVNKGFAPSTQEYEWACQVVEAFDKAQAAGLAAVRVADQFVDYPMYSRAQNILTLHKRIHTKHDT